MIEQLNTTAQLIGNGLTTQIPTNTKIYSSAQLLVYKGDANNLGTLLTEGTDYTVQNVALTSNVGLDSQLNATVVMNVAPLDGVYIRVLRNTPAVQNTSIRSSKPFDPAVVEVVLDKIVMKLQELDKALRSAFKLFQSESDYFIPQSSGVLGFNAQKQLTVVTGVLNALGVSSWLAPLLLSADANSFLQGLGALPANSPFVITDWHDVSNRTNLVFFGDNTAANAPNNVDSFVGLWLAKDSNNGMLLLIGTNSQIVRFKNKKAGVWDTIYNRMPIHYTGNTVINTLSHGAGTYHGVIDQAAFGAPTVDALGNALGNYYAVWMHTGASGYGRHQRVVIITGTFAGYVFERTFDDVANVWTAMKQTFPRPLMHAKFAMQFPQNTLPGVGSTSLATQVLNTIVYNTIPNLTINLTSGVLTVPAGEYEAEAFGYSVAARALLYLMNTTDAVVLGRSASVGAVVAGVQTEMRLRTRFGLTAQKSVALQAIFSAAVQRGIAANLNGTVEEYAGLYLTKLNW